MRVHKNSLLIAGHIDRCKLLDVGDLSADKRHFKILVEINLLGADLCGSLRLSKIGDDLILGLSQLDTLGRRGRLVRG